MLRKWSGGISMIIIGHPWVKSAKFCKISSKDDIQKSKPNEIVLLEPLSDSQALASYCQQNNISYAVITHTLNEAIFANALGAAYILCKEDDARIIQPIAQEYLFDTRILVLIEDEKEISKIANFGIDGVIFPKAIY